MDNVNKKTISRRNFFKIAGAAGMVTAGLTACGEKNKHLAGTYSTVQDGKMTYRTNHNSNDRVSLLGYGMMRLPMLPNPDGGRDIVDQEAVNKLVDYALAHGVNYFDTDVGLLDFLRKERETGRIRNLGWSFHGDVEIFDYLLSIHDEVHWDFVQIQLNYADWKHATGWNTNAEYLYGELAKRNIPVVVMEPLLGGRLSRLPDHLVVALKQHAPERSTASWAFRFAGTFPNVLTVLSGMTYMEHLQDNVHTYSPLVACTDEELVLLEQTATLFLEYPNIPCTACEYCMPCPYGIDIPGIFTHYNKCVNEGNVLASDQDENYRKARRAFLVGYDRSVPRLRQASHCTGCNQCVHHCPQSIKIPEELHRIDRFVESLKQHD